MCMETICPLNCGWSNRKQLVSYLCLVAYGRDCHLEKLLRHLRIEKETKKRDAMQLSQNSKVNHVSEEKVNKGKRNKSSVDVKQDKKRQRTCYHCHKKGHYIKDCRLLKMGNNSKEVSSSKTNLVEENDLVAMITERVQCMDIDMIIELNMAMQGRSLEWWLDSSAIVHVYNDRNCSYQKNEVGAKDTLTLKSVMYKEYASIKNIVMIIPRALSPYIESNSQLALMMGSINIDGWDQTNYVQVQVNNGGDSPFFYHVAR